MQHKSSGYPVGWCRIGIRIWSWSRDVGGGIVEKKRLVVELDVCEKEKDTSDRKAVTLW